MRQLALRRRERLAMKGRKTTVRIGRATKKPDRVLADDAYWNVPFLDRFLRRCDEVAIDEPQKAYAMAAPVVELADTRITVLERPGAYLSAVERRSYRVHARAVLASCARRVGELNESENLYAAAFEIAKKPIHSDAKASLHFRHGWLLHDQGMRAAIDEADTAIELASNPITRAAALLLRGATAFRFEPNETGLEQLARAANLAKTERASKRGARVFYAALLGVAKILSECNPAVGAQAEAYALLEQVRGYLAGRPKSVAKMQVYWQMGRISFNLGNNRHGPRLLKRASKGLLELGEKFEYTLVSLDLASFYLQNHEFATYDALVADTYEVLDTWNNPKLLEATSSWSRTVRVSPASLRKTRQAVEQLGMGGPVTPPPCRDECSLAFRH